MAIKNWNNGKPSFSYEGHANLGVNLNRQKNAPLDVSCEYSSVKDMLYYVTEGRYPANGTGVSNEVKDMKKYPYLGCRQYRRLLPYLLSTRILRDYSSWNNTKIVTEYDADWNKLWEKTYDASGKLIESK